MFILLSEDIHVDILQASIVFELLLTTRLHISQKSALKTSVNCILLNELRLTAKITDMASLTVLSLLLFNLWMAKRKTQKTIIVLK